MRAWEEFKDLTRWEVLNLIRTGRLIEAASSLDSRTFHVEIIFSQSKICIVIHADINQLTTVKNEQYNYDPEVFAKLPVWEQTRLRKQTKAYHRELEARYLRGDFRRRVFNF